MESKTFCRLITAVLALCIVPFASVSALASELVSEASETVVQTEVVLETEIPSSETVTEPLEMDQNPDQLQNGEKSEVSDAGFDPNDIVSVDVVRSSNPVQPGEVNGLKKIILQLIGDYDMVTNEYTYTSSNGYTSKQVTTEPDYAWMISAAVFALVLWSLFRFVGGIANGKR